MGELKKNIYIIGSPDIDLMLSHSNPKLSEVRKRYKINFDKYGIVLLHPIVTTYKKKENKYNSEILVNAITKSKFNYVVIHPNNDTGSNTILKSYSKLKGEIQILSSFY